MLKESNLLLIEQFSPVILENFFKAVVFENMQSYLFLEGSNCKWGSFEEDGLYRMPIEPELINRYFYAMALAKECVYLYQDNHSSKVGLSYVLERDLDALEGSNEKCSLIAELMRADLSKVVLPTAIVAWLATDEFRWHKLVSSCPKDLSYGLVTTNHVSICVYAAFIAGFVYTQTDTATSYLIKYSDVLQRCRLFAKTIYSGLPDEVKKICAEEASDATHRTLSSIK